MKRQASDILSVTLLGIKQEVVTVMVIDGEDKFARKQKDSNTAVIAFSREAKRLKKDV